MTVFARPSWATKDDDRRFVWSDGKSYVHLTDGAVGWSGDFALTSCIKDLVAELDAERAKRQAAEQVATEAVRQRDHARDLIAGLEFIDPAPDPVDHDA